MGLGDASRENQTNEEDLVQGKKSVYDEVNELIDLMTLNEANNLNEQLKELEQLEQEKKQRNMGADKHGQSPANKKWPSLFANTKLPFELDSLIPASKSVNSNLATDYASLDSMANPSGGVSAASNLTSFADILNNASDEFEKEWNSAFTSTTHDNSHENNRTTSPLKSDFDFFSSTNNTNMPSASSNEINSLFSQLTNKNSENLFNSSDSSELNSAKNANNATSSKTQPSKATTSASANKVGF